MNAQILKEDIELCHIGALVIQNTIEEEYLEYSLHYGRGADGIKEVKEAFNRVRESFYYEFYKSVSKYYKEIIEQRKNYIEFSKKYKNLKIDYTILYNSKRY